MLTRFIFSAQRLVVITLAAIKAGQADVNERSVETARTQQDGLWAAGRPWPGSSPHGTAKADRSRTKTCAARGGVVAGCPGSGRAARRGPRRPGLRCPGPPRASTRAKLSDDCFIERRILLGVIDIAHCGQYV
eukprot:7312370-Prymnesium_polylepis.2